MFPIRTYNSISPAGLGRFDMNRYSVTSEEGQPLGVLLRSHKLKNHDIPGSVLAVGRHKQHPHSETHRARHSGV